MKNIGIPLEDFATKILYSLNKYNKISQEELDNLDAVKVKYECNNKECKLIGELDKYIKPFSESDKLLIKGFTSSILQYPEIFSTEQMSGFILNTYYNNFLLRNSYKREGYVSETNKRLLNTHIETYHSYRNFKMKLYGFMGFTFCTSIYFIKKKFYK